MKHWRVLQGHLVLLAVFYVLYLGAYWAGAARFTQRMTGLDAAYFAVMIQSTVGLGDVCPVNAAAKLLVMAHIVASVVMSVMLI